MESGDTSDEEAPPCDPKSNNLMQKEWSKVISMVVDMETEDGLKRHVIMVVTKKFSWHMQTYSTTPSGPKYLQQFFLCDPRRTRRFCTRVGLAISEYHPIDEYKLQIA